MPQVEIQSSSGPAVINYTISTPSSENANSIDPSIPTVLFLHPVYVAQVIFHFQFANPKVRRFNLVGFDSRSHGETVGRVPPTYRRWHAAEDVSKFMEALRLPPCHVVGLSLGACVALQMAISYPHQVLSLFMISPLPLIEPEIVAEGRQEIYDYWVAGQKDPEDPDQEALLDAIFGAVQLAFNHSKTSIVNAIVQHTVPQALRNWGPKTFEDLHTVSVTFFVDRKPHPLAVLKKVNCPIQLVHCGGDIAYPLHYVEELRDRMEDAGLDVRISHNPDAAHFGTITHPEPINEFIHDWVLNNTNLAVPPAKQDVTSPYESALAEAGYSKEGDPDSDEDDLFVVAS